MIYVFWSPGSALAGSSTEGYEFICDIGRSMACGVVEVAKVRCSYRGEILNEKFHSPLLFSADMDFHSLNSGPYPNIY